MSETLKILTSGLDRDLRGKILARVDALMRGVKYMQETNNELISKLERQGWNLNRLETICALNAFYQIVLGPLSSSARERTGALGEDIPILYGELIRFDTARSRKIRAAHMAFTEIIAGLPGQTSLITASHADDLVYLLNKALAENENH